MEIIKTYVTVVGDTGQRIELKFLGTTPTLEDVQKKFDEIVNAEPPKPIGCPANNPKCPLFIQGQAING